MPCVKSSCHKGVLACLLALPIARDLALFYFPCRGREILVLVSLWSVLTPSCLFLLISSVSHFSQWRKLWKRRWIALHGLEIVYMDKEPTPDNMNSVNVSKAKVRPLDRRLCPPTFSFSCFRPFTLRIFCVRFADCRYI